MSGRVVIPIHNVHGKVVGYAGRSIDGRNPKYLFPRGFRKNLELFNLHRATGQDVVVVEGFFDCMKIWQALNPFVIALMGSTLSLEQEEILARRFRSATLVLDGDTAGRRAAEVIAQRLVHRMLVRIVNVPDGTQPDMLSKTELARLLKG